MKDYIFALPNRVHVERMKSGSRVLQLATRDRDVFATAREGESPEKVGVMQEEYLEALETREFSGAIVHAEDGRPFLLLRVSDKWEIPKELMDLKVWDSDQKERPEGCPNVQVFDIP